MFWPFTVWGFLKPIFKPHEYWLSRTRCCNSTYRLRYWNASSFVVGTPTTLQQYLPFTVLKLFQCFLFSFFLNLRCNSTYRLRYWNPESIYKNDKILRFKSNYRFLYLNLITIEIMVIVIMIISCNSTYRLRYWNLADIQTWKNQNTLKNQ